MSHCSICQPLRPVEVWNAALFSSWDIFLACHLAGSSRKRRMLSLVHAYGHNPIPTRIEHIIIGISFLGCAFPRWLNPIIPNTTHHLSDVSWDSYTYRVICAKRLFVFSFEHFSWNLGKSLRARACLVSFCSHSLGMFGNLAGRTLQLDSPRKSFH